MYNQRDSVAILMSVAVLETACMEVAVLDGVGSVSLSGGNVVPIERAHLLDEIDNYLLDENDNYLTD